MIWLVISGTSDSNQAPPNQENLQEAAWTTTTGEVAEQLQAKEYDFPLAGYSCI